MALNRPVAKPLEILRSEKGNWFSFLMQLHKANTFWQLFISMFAVAAYTAGLTWWYEDYLGDPVKISTAMHSILGVTLGLLLVFRTNTAYDRWWEGRKLVGSIVNSSRNLAIKLDALLPPERKAERHRLAALISGYFFAMKEHLREGVRWDELQNLDDDLLPELGKVKHVPNRIAKEIYLQVKKIRLEEGLRHEEMIMLDKQLENMTDVVGACERIKKTPLPIAYSMHLKIFIMIYVMTLPFGFMHEMHYWTIPVVCLVFYAMVGIELIGEEIEDPFGRDESDIQMDTIANTIQHNVYEVLAPEELP
jgi:putative membrane protein